MLMQVKPQRELAAVGIQRRTESTHLTGEEEDGGDAQPAVQGVEIGDHCEKEIITIGVNRQTVGSNLQSSRGDTIKLT